MGFFEDHPAIARSNLEAEAKAILGKGASLADSLIEQFGVAGARRVLRRAARLSNEGNRRTQYVSACISKPKRIAELESRLAAMTDPDELAPEELREIDPDDLKEHMHQRHLIETELQVLRGEKSGGLLLAARLGRKKAMKLTIEAIMAAGERRANVILTNAARSEIRHPELYVRRALEDYRGDDD